MADDIDDLLNDIESKIDLTETNQRNRCKFDDNLWDTEEFSSGGQPSRVRQNGDAVEDLSDLLDDGGATAFMTVKLPQKAASNHGAQSTWDKSSSASTTKCFPVCIGGVSSTQGLSTTVSKRACNRLRCTNCDFAVSSFDNVQWSSDTDYLFLRNNMPEYERVRSKLHKQTGSRAYACQCRWLTAKELTDLCSHPNVKWVCGKH